MKWFIVMVGLVGNQTTVFVEDNQPFNTPTACEAQRAQLTADLASHPGRNPVRIFCGGNWVVADFLSGRQ